MAVTNDVLGKHLENYGKFVEQMRAETAIYGSDDPVEVITGDRRLSTGDVVIIIDDKTSPEEKKNLAAFQKNAAFISSGTRPMDVIRKALERPADEGGGYSSPDPEASGNFAGGIAVAGGSILAIVFWPVTATVAGGLFIAGCFSDGTKEMNPRIKVDGYAPDIHVTGDDIWGDLSSSFDTEGVFVDVAAKPDLMPDIQADTDAKPDLTVDVVDVAILDVKDVNVEPDIPDVSDTIDVSGIQDIPVFPDVPPDEGVGQVDIVDVAVLDTKDVNVAPDIPVVPDVSPDEGISQVDIVDVAEVQNYDFLDEEIVGQEYEFISVVTGDSHSCALETSGQVYCWGWNKYGQVGNGSFEKEWVPVEVLWMHSVIALSTLDGHHTCVIRENKAAWCWGRNDHGQLGSGLAGDTPVPVGAGIGNVKDIAAGFLHTCAVKMSGTVYCWGYNGFGQLGDGSTIDTFIATKVENLGGGVKSVDAGHFHTCALKYDGTVWCWGDGQHGQLGNLMFYQTPLTPTQVFALNDVTDISVGTHHACAIKEDGSLWCWGKNNPHGQLGDGTYMNKAMPVQVELNGAIATGAGGTHSCAVVDDGVVWCWGYNSNGQLGIGSETSCDNSICEPLLLDGLSDIKTIAGGFAHNCAIAEDSASIWCWGANQSGALGNGGVYSPWPTQVLFG